MHPLDKNIQDNTYSISFVFFVFFVDHSHLKYK
jgi:hypothetical protein